MIATMYCTTSHFLSFTWLCQSLYTIHKLCTVYVNKVSLTIYHYIPNSITVHNTQIMYFYMNKIKIIELLLSLHCMLRNVTQVRNPYESKVVFLILYYCCHWTDNTQMIYWNNAFIIICLLLSLYTIHVLWWCIVYVNNVSYFIYHLLSEHTLHTLYINYVKKVSYIIYNLLPLCAYTIHELCIVYVNKVSPIIYLLLSLYTLVYCFVHKVSQFIYSLPPSVTAHITKEMYK
jgi:hypothetical protein